MGNSLQDQLFKAGLASKKQSVRARKAKNTKEKQQRKGVEVVNETAELVARTDAEKLAKDKQLNQQRDKAAHAKAIQAQIVELVSLNKIGERGDIEFRYNHNGKIKSISLTSDIRDLLVTGNLNIVCVNQQHEIVPKAVATKIAERDADAIVLANQNTLNDNEQDDEYADYKVPDDLMW